ncbi:hypothetical protein Tco_0712155 [Tanacetum coccineum]
MSIQDMEDLKQQYLDEMKTLINGKDYRNGNIDIEIKINELKGNFNEMSIEIRKKEKEQLEQVANLSTYPSRHFNLLVATTKMMTSIQKTESDESLKSSVAKPCPNLEDFSDIESECDVPDCDDSQTINFSTFSNPLFDDSTSSDDESSHEEVIHEMSFKTYSNPLFDLEEEIISSEFNPIHNEDLDSTLKDVRFDSESYLLESLVNRDTLMASPPKIDFLLDEFAESLLYDNSSPRPPKASQDNSNTIIEPLPTFPIPVEDSDSLREEIDIFSGPDDSIPPGIESDDFDSEDDNNSTSHPEFDSFHVDYPDSEDSTINMVEDIPVDVPNILPTHPILQLDFNFIPSNDLGYDLDVSSPFGDRNKIYDLGICIEDCPDFKASRARGFCPSFTRASHPQLHFGNPISKSYQAYLINGLGFTVFNSPCFMVKSWLVQDQTVLGKDYSNLLIADSLLKTIWFINAPCYGNEALASPKANELTIPEQTATGKGTSNPFMAGSLPKTIKPT